MDPGLSAESGPDGPLSFGAGLRIYIISRTEAAGLLSSILLWARNRRDLGPEGPGPRGFD